MHVKQTCLCLSCKSDLLLVQTWSIDISFFFCFASSNFATSQSVPLLTRRLPGGHFGCDDKRQLQLLHSLFGLPGYSFVRNDCISLVNWQRILVTAFCHVLRNFHWVQQYVVIGWCAFRFHTQILSQTQLRSCFLNGRKIPRWPFSRM